MANYTAQVHIQIRVPVTNPTSIGGPTDKLGIRQLPGIPILYKPGAVLTPTDQANFSGPDLAAHLASGILK